MARHFRFWIALGLVLLVATAVVAVACGSVLSWDGSFLLFATVDDQAPCLPHNRYTLALLAAPALLASKLSADTRTIELW